MVNILNFCIDTTFIFNNTHKAFLGAPLFVKDGEDTTFLYGFLRDFLRIRQLVGINNGVLIIGKEATSVTSKENVLNVVNLIKEMKIPYIYNSNHSVIEICNQLRKEISYIISQDKRLLQVANDEVSIIIPKDQKNIVCMSRNLIKSKMGIAPECIPTFLSLTEGVNPSKLTKLQTIRLLELYGDLDNIYANITKITPAIKKKLILNKDLFFNGYSDVKIKDNCVRIPADTQDWTIRLNDEKIVSILNSYGFYSLTRLLENPPQVQLDIKKDKSKLSSYHAIVDLKGLKKLEKVLLTSKLCSIDTESDDKDPRQATLFGVSFSVKKGEAYFLPLLEEDLKDINCENVISFLKRILKEPIKCVGHNIKYDYLLLRRNGINIKNIYFDTLLAAYDCFGDWTFLNLKHLSLKLLGKNIKSYKEIVDKHQSFLDLPFKQIVKHGCEDADVTLQLYYKLSKELKLKKIWDQYYDKSLPLVKQLGDMEFHGIPVEVNKLENARNDILSRSLRTKKVVYDKIGMKFDIDSHKELSIILNKNLNLQQFVGSKKITLALIKQLAITKPELKLIAKYKTFQSQLRKIDSILRKVNNNKIYPLFNQTKLPFGVISSISPDILGFKGAKEFKDCFSIEIKPFFRNGKKAIGFIRSIAQDSSLNDDWVKKTNQYMTSHPLMKELDTDELFLAIITGYSDYKLSKEFMLDRLDASTIRHDVELRYPILFSWIKQIKKRILDQGYILHDNKRKYFDGLKSSNLEKRKIAVNNSIRWLLEY